MSKAPARKRLLVVLPSDTYRALSDMAAQHERLVEQQAAIILRRALRGGTWPDGQGE